MHHHGEPEGHLPAPGRHSAQVSSQVKSNPCSLSRKIQLPVPPPPELASSAPWQAQEDVVCWNSPLSLPMLPSCLVSCLSSSAIWSLVLGTLKGRSMLCSTCSKCMFANRTWTEACMIGHYTAILLISMVCYQCKAVALPRRKQLPWVHVSPGTPFPPGVSPLPPLPPPPPGHLMLLKCINTVWRTQLDILLWCSCRSFGCSAPVGTVYSINPAMIMTLVPLVGAAATHYSHFDMIHYGSYVSALSPLWMALFTTGNVPTPVSPSPVPFQGVLEVKCVTACILAEV